VNNCGNVDNLQSTGAGCHDKIVSHKTPFVPQYTFGQTHCAAGQSKKYT